MPEGFVTQELSGWGRCPVARCRVYRPEKRSSLRALLTGGGEPGFIARGLGRSYGDAALNSTGGVVSFARLNRFLALDEQAGILECEGGVSLAEILDVIVPRGFFLPVTPGTRFVTVGGAIAADVHGKNHHRDGTFGRFVVDLRLLTASGEVLTCSPERGADVFWATVGGMGLTGLVLSARLRLLRIESSYLLVDFLRTKDLDETVGKLAESEERYPYSVAWVDALAGGGKLGRGVLICGRHAQRSELPRRISNPLRLPRPLQVTVPCDCFSPALNRLTGKCFNSFYYATHGAGNGVLTDYDAFFYPLDKVNAWNRLYGRRGFTQYQVGFPPAGSAAGLRELLERLVRSPHPSFLAVLKSCGEADAGLLSFPFRGYTLALDIPWSPGLADFLHQLDALVLRHGGRLYLAKDAAMKPETFAAMYPQAEKFRQIKARLDERGLFSSDQARRVGLCRAP